VAGWRIQSAKKYVAMFSWLKISLKAAHGGSAISSSKMYFGEMADNRYQQSAVCGGWLWRRRRSALKAIDERAADINESENVISEKRQPQWPKKESFEENGVVTGESRNGVMAAMWRINIFNNNEEMAKLWPHVAKAGESGKMSS
jgi:hypothetical protein